MTAGKDLGQQLYPVLSRMLINQLVSVLPAHWVLLSTPKELVSPHRNPYSLSPLQQQKNLRFRNEFCFDISFMCKGGCVYTTRCMYKSEDNLWEHCGTLSYTDIHKVLEEGEKGA